MSLWGNVDNANNRPKYANTADVLGISVSEAQANTGVAHPGWVKVTLGTGPVLSVAVGVAGTGYANGDVVAAANTYGSGFAGTVVTNGSGAVTAVTITSRGQYSQAPVLTITSDLGASATLTATVGGRAGRASQETLVAMSSIS